MPIVTLEWFSSLGQNANPQMFQYLQGKIPQQLIRLKRVAWQWGGNNTDTASQFLNLRVRLPFLNGWQLQSNAMNNSGYLVFPNKRFETDQIFELDWEFQMSDNIEQPFEAQLEAFDLNTDSYELVDMSAQARVHDAPSVAYFAMFFEYSLAHEQMPPICNNTAALEGESLTCVELLD
jgi:hypothetical protein